MGLLIAASGQDFTAIGHALALTLGVMLSMRFHAAARWVPTQLVLLAVSVVFGYVMLVGSSPMTAPIVGGAGAVDRADRAADRAAMGTSTNPRVGRRPDPTTNNQAPSPQ
jgi:hypothetical protein